MIRVRKAPGPEKPPYAVPGMAEIAVVPQNGLVVASLFAGAGGSALGYRMAGYRVAWANEIVPAAAECHRLAFSDCVHDGRDVRTVRGAEVLKALGLRRGELDLLDGSPPCQPFSTAGKREQGWKKRAAHADGTVQRSDDLFYEFARLVREIGPRAFVAENVSGLVKGTAKGYFKRILAALQACGYAVEARLLDAQWLGVPQARVRLIFVGVRRDIAAAGFGPAFPDPLPYRYSVAEACPWIVGARVAAGNDAFEPIFADARVGPSPTIMASGARTSGIVEGIGITNSWRGAKNDPKRLDAPSPTICAQTSGGEIVLSRPAHGYFPGKEQSLDEPAPTVTAMMRGFGDVRVVHAHGGALTTRRGKNALHRPSATTRTTDQAQHAVEIEGANGFNRHAGRNADRPAATVQAGRSVAVRLRHIADFGRGKRRSLDAPAPTIMMAGRAGSASGQVVVEGAPPPPKLSPSVGAAWDGTKIGEASERFFSLVKPDPDRPSPTITMVGGTGCAGVSHPFERRKLSILEVKRLCSFPDDFPLVGTFQQQWARLGNAVPPLMMKAIAEAVRDRVLLPARRRRKGQRGG